MAWTTTAAAQALERAMAEAVKESHAIFTASHAGSDKCVFAATKLGWTAVRNPYSSFQTEGHMKKSFGTAPRRVIAERFCKSGNALIKLYDVSTDASLGMYAEYTIERDDDGNITPHMWPPYVPRGDFFKALRRQWARYTWPPTAAALPGRAFESAGVRFRVRRRRAVSKRV